MASPLTILYGPSGAGKTSVLHAGVAHDLRRRARGRANGQVPDLAVAVVDAWRDDPVQAVLDAVRAELTDAAGEDVAASADGAGSLSDALAAWTRALGGDLYLVLDQFDEYLLYHESEDGAGSLAQELPEALAQPGLRVGFLVALREDQLARLDRFRGRIPSLFANSLRLDRLGRDAARAAILGPLERFAALDENGGGPGKAEPELVDAVLDEVAAAEAGPGNAVEAPYLQLVMQRVWHAEAEAGSDVLRLETLRELGGAARVVHGHLEEAMATLDPPEREIAASVFNHLVTPSGTKIAHGVADLAVYASVAEAELNPVLSRLADTRILRPVAAADGSGETRYEIFHDVLADPVRDWRRTHAEERRLASERDEARRRHRRLLLVAGASLVGLAIAVALAIFALTQRSEAREQAERAQQSAAAAEDALGQAEAASQEAQEQAAAAEEASLEAEQQAEEAQRQTRLRRARELAAVALTQLDVDPDLSVLLAVEAAKLEPLPEVGAVLTQSLLRSQTQLILRADGPVNVAAYNDDGTRILTASDDGQARVYAAGTGELLVTLEHGEPVLAAAFSPDGNFVATGSVDGTARIWDGASGDEVAVLEHGGTVTAVAWHPDGTRLAAGSRDGFARVWDLQAQTALLELPHPEAVTLVTFDPPGEQLMTGAEDHVVRVYSATGGGLIGELEHGGRVTSASFRPDGEFVLTTSNDRLARLWIPGPGPGQALPGPQGPFFHGEFSPTGLQFATASSDGAARVWSVLRARRLVLMIGHQNHVLDASYSPNGVWIATASKDRTARTWRAGTGAPIAVLAGHTDTVVSAVFSPDGRWVLTASDDGTARVWNPDTGDDLLPVGRHDGRVSSAAFSPDGSLVVSTSEEGPARIWRADPTDRDLVAELAHGGAAVVSAAFGEAGSTVATGGEDGTVRLWSAPDGALLQTLDEADGAANTVALSPNGSLVAAGTETRALLWQAESGELRGEVPHDAQVTEIAFSPDGRLIVTGSADRRARIADAMTGEVLHLLRGHRGPLVDVAFSPDGRLVVTASADGTARLWDVASGDELHRLEGHRDALTSAAFSPDGRLVVTTSTDADGRTWDVATGEELEVLRGHFGLVTDAAFNPDSDLIVTAGPVTAGLWDAASGRLLLLLQGHRQLVTSASFSPDGQQLVTSSYDRTVRMYDCDVCRPLDARIELAEQRLERIGRELTDEERGTLPGAVAGVQPRASELQAPGRILSLQARLREE